MNEQLTNWLIEQTKNITNWTSVEIPAFVQEYLNWNFYNGIVNSSLFFILISICIYVTVKLKKKCREEEDLWPLVAIMILPIFVSCAFFVCEVKEVIKIKIAPKAYLMDKVLQVKQ